MKKVLIIASSNVHKIREFRSILKHFNHLDILSLRDFPSYVPPEETGSTFEANAILKAVSAAKALNQLILADDSGLIIPALNGAPGIFSARYAGDKATDMENRKKLLEDMRHLTDIQRQGYFECCLALATPKSVEKCVRGVTEGMITLEERGSGGFGYDSLFIKHEYGKTFAELEEDVKNRISPRRKALDKLLLTLESLCV